MGKQHKPAAALSPSCPVAGAGVVTVGHLAPPELLPPPPGRGVAEPMGAAVPRLPGGCSSRLSPEPGGDYISHRPSRGGDGKGRAFPGRGLRLPRGGSPVCCGQGVAELRGRSGAAGDGCERGSGTRRLLGRDAGRQGGNGSVGGLAVGNLGGFFHPERWVHPSSPAPLRFLRGPHGSSSRPACLRFPPPPPPRVLGTQRDEVSFPPSLPSPPPGCSPGFGHSRSHPLGSTWLHTSGAERVVLVSLSGYFAERFLGVVVIFPTQTAAGTQGCFGEWGGCF